MISTSEVALGPLFERVYRKFRNRAQRRGVDLRIVPVERQVRTEASMLEQILAEALNAALGFTSGGRILMGARRRHGHLALEIWAQQLPRTMGGQAGDGERSLPSGLVVAERLGGLLNHPVQVWNGGSGLFLRMELPLVASRTLAARAAARGSRLIVVIDDEPSILEGLSLLLEAWGFEVVAAESEEAAIAKLAARKDRPSVILADYRLRGGHTGTEAVKHIREFFKETIPSFLITGETQPERLKEAHASGLMVLQKPVQPPRLQSLLSQTIKARA